MRSKMMTMLVMALVMGLASSASASPQITAVDAWGSDWSVADPQFHGFYGAAAGSQLFDGVTANQAYPARAQVGGGTYQNLWMFLDLGQDYLVDQVKLYHANQNGYPTWLMYISTAPDGSDFATQVWTPLGTYGADDGTDEGHADGSYTAAGAWVLQDTFNNGSSSSVQDRMFAPVQARYVKIFTQGYEYGGFALAEMEVFGVIPEPSSWLLLMAGAVPLAGLLIRRRRRA